MRLVCIYIISLFLCSPLCHATPSYIRVGVVGPLSGPYSVYGKQIWQGASQAAEQVNQSGGIHGAQLELIPLDDRCEPQFAIQQANRLIHESKVQIVIGHACSTTTLATQQQYADAGVLMITPSATHNKITAHGLSTIFRMAGKNELQAQSTNYFLQSQLQAKRVAILYSPSLYGKNLAEHVIDGLTQAKIAPVLTQTIHLHQTNFSELVKKIMNLEVDAIYVAGYYPEVGALIRALNHQQVYLPVLTSDGAANEGFLQAAGGPSAAKATMTTFDPRIQHLGTQGYYWHGFAAVESVAQALQASQQTQGDKLSHWLHQHQVHTVLGALTWDTNGDPQHGDYQIYLWNKAGTFEAIRKN